MYVWWFQVIKPRLAQLVKNLPAVQETWVWSLGWEDSLEKEMAIHSSILAWRIPQTEEPSRLQSMGSQESDTTQWLTLQSIGKRLSVPQVWGARASGFVGIYCVCKQPRILPPTLDESEVLVAQSCLTVCYSMDCSLPGFSVHEIFQAVVLEWIAISFSRGSSWPRIEPRSPAL